MWPAELWLYIQHESYDVFEWAKCGTSALSAAPTLLWAAGAAALVQRLLAALFRRFLFRRVPWWELLLQHLLFVWMVIYSVHFWVVLVRVVKVLVDYVYDETMNTVVMFEDPPEAASRYLLQQWALWACAAIPLAVFIHTRPRPEPPPLMIWITTSPWQRREMGPHGYYLQRPPARAPPPTPRVRRALSDSDVPAARPKRNNYSKSDLCDSHLEALAKWLSCNGETWGVGPTAVFASAAALFLYNELEATVFAPGDHAHVSLLEKTLISSMVVGMLALMIHIWVCSMRFFQYYLDTLIRDSPNVLLEMTTAGLLGGGQTELVALGPLTRFLKQQQPQIHITLCWFLSLCYADYVRKHYCTRFNMPYLEQWQTELHARAASHVRATMARVHSFVGGVHRRLRGFGPAPATTEAHTGTAPNKQSCMELSGACSRVSWPGGCGGGSGTELSPEKELCVRLVGQSSETAADAIEKLRAYIKATRCSCAGNPDTGLCGIEHLTPKEGDK